MQRLIQVSLFFLTLQVFGQSQNTKAYHVTPKNQRVIIIMIDGFSPDYLHSSDLPFLKKIMHNGFYKEVEGVMPSVTTVNNASIICGVWPSEHGIVGNTFFDERNNTEKLMEDTSLLLAPTIFERAQKFNIKSALFSSKLKTIKVLSRGADIALSPEIATTSWINAVGTVPDKYTADVNYWTCRALIYTLKSRPDIGLYYLHTTDYPMHMWKANDARSLNHMHTLDSLLGVMAQVAPDAAILVTADHGMNHKTKVHDLKNILAGKGLTVKAAISPLKDLYPKHHSGYGGIAYVFLQNKTDSLKMRDALLGIDGIEKVFSGDEFSKKYHQMRERIGDFVVFGDKQTVFGELEDDRHTDQLSETYRTHGSLYELKVPLFIYNISRPPSTYFKNNLDLARWLY